MRPAEGEQDVLRQPGELLVSAVTIAHDNDLVGLQAGKMRTGYRGAAARVDTVEDDR